VIEVYYDKRKLPSADLIGILVAETKLVGLVNNCPLRRSAVPYDSMELYKGSDRRLRVYVRDPNLGFVDLTGGRVIFTVKYSKSEVAVVFKKDTAIPAEGQLGAAKEGEAFFYIVPADTLGLQILQYVYDVRVILADGMTYTVCEGVINLQEPVGEVA
jgi:hypothetical protein